MEHTLTVRVTLDSEGNIVNWDLSHTGDEDMSLSDSLAILEEIATDH